MEDLLFFFTENLDVVIFGICMNIALTFGFGFYKTLNLNYQQTVVLMDKYPVKTKTSKLLALWFLPWLGVGYIFYEVIILQKYINSGFKVYDYLEHKLQREFEKQNGDYI